MDRALVALTVVTAVGCGLNAGVFFAFSSFVMTALAHLQPAQGITAKHRRLRSAGRYATTSTKHSSPSDAHSSAGDA